MNNHIQNIGMVSLLKFEKSKMHSEHGKGFSPDYTRV